MLRMEDVIKDLEETYPNTIESLSPATEIELIKRQAQLDVIAYLRMKLNDTKPKKKG